MTADVITLLHGTDRCELHPRIGGSIGCWTADGQQMFRAANAARIAARDPFGMASFPLVPYSNRIDQGKFAWNGSHIALARNFPDSMRHQDHSHWGQQDMWDKPQHLTELNGCVLLIVGFGSIGRELAKRARAFDMRVWGVTRSGKGDAALAEKIVPISKLEETLPHADYVVIAAPETSETRRFFGAGQIARMKAGARLINVGRGSLLDEAALIRALESGALSGAAIDVTSVEPLPPESPLWKAPNLFITPHTSAVGDRLWQRETDLLMDLLERWFDGREMFNQVDLTRGY
jgi:phosphoglycerate dehydrogenase-like enzyme